MERVRVFIGLVVLFGVGFMPAEELDSLKRDLLKQKIFYASDDLWIPPSLPSDKECVGVGCCLMPVGGFLIIREALKKEEKPESFKSVMTPKFSIGLGYSPGIAYAGRELKYPVSSPLIDLGKIPESIASWFYWNNILEIDVRYHIARHWALGIGGGYMWSKLNERNPWFSPKDSIVGKNPVIAENCYWEITTFYEAIGCFYYFNKSKKNSHLGIGVEYNISEGRAYGEWTEWNTSVYPSEIVQQFIGKALRWGRGFGSFVNIGFARPMTKNISFNISLIIRYSLSKEYKWELPSWAILDKPINYSFTGVYLKVGCTYSLFKQQTDKEEK